MDTQPPVVELAQYQFSGVFTYAIDIEPNGTGQSASGCAFDRIEAHSWTGNIAASRWRDEYPHLMKLTTEHILYPGYDVDNEYEFGLNLF